MATQVYTSEEITLQDGKTVTLKPLPIGRLRRFMKAWNVFGEAKSDEEGFDVLVNCAGISLEADFKGVFDSLKAPEPAEDAEGQDKFRGFISDEYREHLEDSLDLDTIYKILDVCGGLKLNDPKLMEAALMAAQNQEQDGTN